MNDAEVFGLRKTTRAVLAATLAPRYEDAAFDRRFGTDTSSLVSIMDGQIPSELQHEAQRYVPAAEAVVRHVLKRLPLRPKDCTFVDVGCGKGRVVLMAAGLPFARVLGVELSPVTSAIARRNIEIVRSKAPGVLKCADIEVATENALDLTLPDANLVFFLYNPFQGSLFEAFMMRVYEFSIAHPQRDVYVAYVNPWFCIRWLERCGLFRKVFEHRVILPQWSWNLWVPVRGPVKAHGN